MSTIYIYVVIIIVIVMMSIGLGCGSKTGETPQSDWFVDDQGVFSTHDIQRAQNEIPFDITFPSYIPDDLPVAPHINGLIEEAWPDDISMLNVRISYQVSVTNGIKGISITEFKQSTEHVYSGTIDSSEFILIDGFRVKHWESSVNAIVDGNPTSIKAYSFSWNHNDVFISVQVYGYEHAEAIKVVESMIQQE